MAAADGDEGFILEIWLVKIFGAPPDGKILAGIWKGIPIGLLSIRKEKNKWSVKVKSKKTRESESSPSPIFCIKIQLFISSSCIFLF